MKSNRDSGGGLTERYLAEVERRLVTHFDLHHNERLGRTPLAFVAHYRRKDEKYLLTRSARIWEVENRQLLFVHCSPTPLDRIVLERFEEDLRGEIDRFSAANSEHMSSVIVGVTVTPHSVVEGVVRKAVNYRKLKYLKFGLHGWLEAYLAVVDLDNRRIHVHPKGLPFAEVFQQAFQEEQPP